MANPNILNNLTKYVSEELAKDNIPSDSRYVIVGTVNNDGVKVLAAVNIKQTEKLTVKVASIWEHDWDGDDTLEAKIIFTGK